MRYFDSAKLSALFEASAEELGSDDLIPKIAKKMVPSGFSDPGFLALFGMNFGVVLRKAILAQRLGHDRPILDLRRDRLGDYIVWDDTACLSKKMMHLGFIIIIESLRLTGEDALYDIKHISFAHSKSEEESASEEGSAYFFDAVENPSISILHDRPHNRIEFRRGFFDLANPHCNNRLKLASKKQRSEDRWQARPYAKSCYDYLIYLLDKPGPNLDSAAESFAMAERTLRRKLVAEGTSFREVLEWVRRDICHLYFLEGKRQLSDISTLLGYSELSAFTRAYTSWYGHPPSKDASGHAKMAA
ncbi:MAG: helix-turn-helix domain-containing protein [Parasphingorhabdus sp.]